MAMTVNVMHLMMGILQVDHLIMSMYMLWKLKWYVQPCEEHAVRTCAHILVDAGNK